MANLGEIEQAMIELLKHGINRDKITILHCTSEYPATINSINLLAMKSIKDAFKTRIGYSDHSEG